MAEAVSARSSLRCLVAHWWLLLWVAVGICQPAWAARHSYHVGIDAQLAWLTVRACLDTPVPESLYAPSARFDRYVDALELSRADGAGRALRAVEGRVQLPADTVAGDCVVYRLAVGRAATPDGRDEVTRFGRDLVASPDLWLLRPELDAGVELQVRFDLPPGVHVSVPWRPLGASGEPSCAASAGACTGKDRTFLIAASPDGWRPLAVFAHAPADVLSVPGARLELTVLDARPAADPARVGRWLQAAAGQVAGVYGRFPVPRLQIVVTPVRGSRAFAGRKPRGPVPFARVLRSGGPAAQFFIDQRASLEALLADWTATHEFAHLLLPYVERGDAWLSEGLASYYQNVLRARAGAITELQGWQAMHAGFMRGQRQRYHDTLAESIAWRGPNMIMRMYWSGAAMALLADVELRTGPPLPNGAPASLDSVLERLQRCCLSGGRTWSGRQLFERLDALAGRAVFMPLYDRYVNEVTFPEYELAYDRLGLIAQGASLRINESAPGAALRRAIMAPRRTGGDD